MDSHEAGLKQNIKNLSEVARRNLEAKGLSGDELEAQVASIVKHDVDKLEKYRELRAAQDALPSGEWVHVGNIGVDAGCVTIGDPCYFPVPLVEYERLTGLDGGSNGTYDINSDIKGARHDYHLEEKSRSIDEERGAGRYSVEIDPQAKSNADFVTVSAGWGDGAYPVYVKYSKEKRVAEVKVVFITPEEEEWPIQ